MVVSITGSGGGSDDSDDGGDSTASIEEGSGDPSRKGERALEEGVWVVGEGDTLTLISDETGLSQDELIELNSDIDDISQGLTIGQRIALTEGLTESDSSSGGDSDGDTINEGAGIGDGTGEGDGGPALENRRTRPRGNEGHPNQGDAFPRRLAALATAIVLAVTFPAAALSQKKEGPAEAPAEPGAAKQQPKPGKKKQAKPNAPAEPSEPTEPAAPTGPPQLDARAWILVDPRDDEVLASKAPGHAAARSPARRS